MGRFETKLFRAIIFSFSIAVAGCATKYQEMGLTGGFTDKMIDQNTGIVVISGNGFTSEEKVRSMLMLRASEMTVQNGHQRFSLLTIEDQGALDAQKAGKLAAYLREKAARENFGPRLTTATTTVFSTYATLPINKSGGGFFVVMYKGNEGGAYEAGKLIAGLKPKLASN
jgi:hypothetical protein